jgi:hypothetical protein
MFQHAYFHPGRQDCRDYDECHDRAYGLDFRVGGFGRMYASCSVYGCSSFDGHVVSLGSVEIRLCRVHAREMTRQMRRMGTR